MSDYKSPGVYVEEFNGLSLGIQSSPAAVPVFVGHFDSLLPVTTVQCVRIDSWLSFTQLFESDANKTFIIQVSGGNNDVLKIGGTHVGAASVRLFFENGGGACYVLPINTFNAKNVAAIAPAIELCPEITLLCWCERRTAEEEQSVMSALQSLVGNSSYGGIQSRFLLTDAVLEGDKISVPGVGRIQQAAAYFPALRTTYRYVANIDNVLIQGIQGGEAHPKKLSELRAYCDKLSSDIITLGKVLKSSVESVKLKVSNLDEVLSLLDIMKDQVGKGGAVDELSEANKAKLAPLDVNFVGQVDKYIKLYATSSAFQTLLNKVVALANTPVVLRASVAMAGVYARVDRERGVWKAPANVELSGVAGLVAVDSTGAETDIRIDDAFNEKLVSAGVNAVRAFTGRGYMVWGARTMTETSDLNWRYVPVRRLFSTVERDIQDALRAVVFEPNSQPTWVGVRSAISQYLNRLWKQGALAGATPAEAFFVRVGLNETMTVDDVSQGRLVVRVGLAAVRPAEFIVLQLTQDIIAA